MEEIMISRDGKGRFIHGDYTSRLYRIWKGLRQRCNNANGRDYWRYGGRGISVSPDWDNSYVEFKNWAMLNGYKDSLSIDRIDNDGNYEPSNCRWVTQLEQTHNQGIQSNNKTGHTGVFYNKKTKKYRASLQTKGGTLYLGEFMTADLAAEVRYNYIIKNGLTNKTTYKTKEK